MYPYGENTNSINPNGTNPNEINSNGYNPNNYVPHDSPMVRRGYVRREPEKAGTVVGLVGIVLVLVSLI